MYPFRHHLRLYFIHLLTFFFFLIFSLFVLTNNIINHYISPHCRLLLCSWLLLHPHPGFSYSLHRQLHYWYFFYSYLLVSSSRSNRTVSTNKSSISRNVGSSISRNVRIRTRCIQIYAVCNRVWRRFCTLFIEIRYIELTSIYLISCVPTHWMIV